MGKNNRSRRFASGLIILLATIFIHVAFAKRVDACGDQTVANLYANGSSLVIGTVILYRDETNLYVKFETKGDWVIRAAHLDIAEDVNVIPHTSKGNPKVGNFRYKSEPGLQNEYTFEINSSGPGINLHSNFYVAAHADVALKDASGKIIHEEGAWAGEDLLSAHNKATYFEAVVNTCENGDWAITFTNRGALLVDEAVSFTCDVVIPEMIVWLEREATRYGQQLPFSNIWCLDGQMTLNSNLLGTYTGWPLNDAQTINYLESEIPELTDQTFVSVIHYVGGFMPFYQHAYNEKYDFFFFTKWDPLPYPSLYPGLRVDEIGETLIHEFMHKLGASDKYYNTPERACQIDPLTGEEYSGYDIMCHRIGTPGEGYTLPPLTELLVTEATAREIGWLSP